MRELDARTATVEEVMEALGVPRDEAEHLLHEMRGEFEPDIILVPSREGGEPGRGRRRQPRALGRRLRR